MRFRLREFERGDFASVHEYASDSEVTQHMEWGPNSEADTQSFIDQVLSDREQSPRLMYDRAITLADTGEVIGSASIRIRDLKNQNADFGYVLNRRYWGQGLATEVALELVRFGFEELKLHRIFATCRPDNHASARVLMKAGLMQEGHLKHTKLIRGVWVDSLLFARVKH
ncbi:MAG: N-acetyltransferase [Proteobacteria bacterium]|nr:MAG: N-acetyltransferase [Pseudomonadota bacterium]